MKNLTTFVRLAVFLMLGCHVLGVTASAIPMWEFLSRYEKMSHLFRVFSQQVAKFCADSLMPDCNKNLLISGVRSLANMDDNVLDQLDPYQRGAKEMIWRAMVKSGQSRIGYDSNESYFTPETDPLATGDSDTNGIGEETIAAHDYVRPPSEHTGPYLVGPMVIRVFPDGRPVPEDVTSPMPRDEDLEELVHPRIPSIEEIKTQKNVYEKLSKGNSYSEAKNHRRSQEESAHLLNGYPSFKRRLLQQVVAKHKVHYY